MTDAAHITVIGGSELSLTLHELSVGLDDLELANEGAAELLLERARPRTPRRSGRLAASGRVDATREGAAIEFTEIYAGVIHNGWPAHNIDAQPWLLDTIQDDASSAVDVYREYVGDLLHHVKGA